MIREASRRVTIVKCDLSDKEQVKTLVERSISAVTTNGDQKAESVGSATLGSNIDILVNCGGIQRRHKAETFPDSDWDEVGCLRGFLLVVPPQSNEFSRSCK